MSSDSDTLSYFTPLDELIQVIYQGSARFVIISSVDDASWTVHVGLTGTEGRWWRGRWTEKDVKNTVGSKVSSFLLEPFVEKIADTFIKGEISIGDWSSAKGAAIELVLRTSVKTPIRIPLVELPPSDAAAFAVTIFAEIALQAQSRRCRLHPSTSAAYELDIPKVASTAKHGAGTSSSAKAVPRRSPSPEPVTRTKHSSPPRTKGKDKAKAKAAPEAESTASETRYKRKAAEAEEQIEALKAELQKAKRKQDAIMTSPSKLLPLPKAKVAAVTRPKGASLANPTKKARKYQALEFESDEE